MKKIILSLVMLISTAAFSQETFGLYYDFSEPSTIGLSLEFPYKKEKDGSSHTGLLNVGMSGLAYEGNLIVGDLTGTGFTAQLGHRNYYKGDKGVFFENFLIYSSIKFDENTALYGNVKGKYRYWSLINPTLGYRFQLGKLSIDPSIGMNWKWEVRGTGIIDNKNYDNLVFKAGIRLAYRL